MFRSDLRQVGGPQADTPFSALGSGVGGRRRDTHRGLVSADLTIPGRPLSFSSLSSEGQKSVDRPDTSRSSQELIRLSERTLGRAQVGSLAAWCQGLGFDVATMS